MSILRSALMGIAALGLALMTACIFSQETSFAAAHPQALGLGRPDCGLCHGEEHLKSVGLPFTRFNHTTEFVLNHRLQAGQNPGVCASCHAPAFCSDCHGGKPGISPATKLANRPDRQTPHKGDYLTRHRFEGKLDPASCFTCHGRANNAKCQGCHRVTP